MQFLALLLSILIAVGSCSTAEARIASPPLPQRTVTSLPDVVSDTLAFHFHDSTLPYKSLVDLAHCYVVPGNLKRSAGVFVTLSINGKTRACWGSITPQYPDLVSAAVFTTEAALDKEYRFPRIKHGEYKLLKPQVTVIRDVKPMNSIVGQNPMLFGLMIRSGNRAAVILPGEASDAYYQLVICKLKAGIQPKEHCQMYRIKADVFKRN